MSEFNSAFPETALDPMPVTPINGISALGSSSKDTNPVIYKLHVNFAQLKWPTGKTGKVRVRVYAAGNTKVIESKTWNP